MKTKLINAIIWLLPDWFITAITMHGLRGTSLTSVAPYVCLRMTEIGLNTPDCSTTNFHVEMDIMEKRYAVDLECRWEKVAPKPKVQP